MYPLVYEDSFSEARPYSIMVFDLFHVFRCIFCYWHLPFLQPGWDEQQGKLPLFYEGTRSFPSFKLLRAEMKLEASKRVFGMQDQVLGTYTLMLWFWFSMYWLYMIEFLHLQFVIDVAVNWLSESFSYLIRNCSIWYVWFVAQHWWVLGMCLMALELH